MLFLASHAFPFYRIWRTQLLWCWVLSQCFAIWSSMIKLTRSRMPSSTQFRREGIELPTLVAVQQQLTLQRQFVTIFEEYFCIEFVFFLTDKRPKVDICNGFNNSLFHVLFLLEPRRRPFLVVFLGDHLWWWLKWRSSDYVTVQR